MSRTARRPARSLPRALAAGILATAVVAIPASGAAPPEPTYAAAVVDGSVGEWDAGDHFADMYRAGRDDKPIESTLSLRYDCDTEVLYALVVVVDGVTALQLEDDAFIKLEGAKLVDGSDGDDGTAPDFAWLPDEQGFEASAPVAPGSYGDLNVHLQVFSDGEPQTSAVLDRAIDLTIDCPVVFGVAVDKTNDADVDEVFSDVETAPVEDAEVAFHVVVTNPATSDVPVEIVGLTDTWPGLETPIDLLADGCSALGGAILEPGASDECTFTLADYAPGPAEEITDTVEVTVSAVIGEADTLGLRSLTERGLASASDTSQVLGPDAVLGLDVDKTNDADGDGTYTDAETAPAPGADVPFRLVVTNPATSNVPVTITSLTDTWPGLPAPVDLLTGGCADLAGAVLAPGDSATCEFVTSAHAPAAGQALTDIVTAGGVWEDLAASAEDGSTVRSPSSQAAPALAVTIDKTNDADADGVFRDVEIADAVAADVTFRVVVTNTGDAAVTITALTDTFGEVTLDLLSTGFCSELDGVSLAPDEIVTCDFTVENYSPADGDEVVNDVTVTVVNGDREATASDDSAVLTAITDVAGVRTDRPAVPAPAAQAAPTEVAGASDLPATGRGAAPGIALGLLFVALGAWLLQASSARPVRARIGPM